MGRFPFYESAQLLAVTGPAIRPGGTVLTARAAEFCRLKAGARVLDVGCGTGATVRFLRDRYGLAVCGLDLSEALLSLAAGLYAASPCLARGRAEQLPVAAASLAALFCECVLCLLPDPSAALREMNRVLEPGGRLVLADLYKRRPRAAGNEKNPAAGAAAATAVSCLNGAVGADCVQQRLAAAGFRIGLWEDHSSLLKQLAAQLVLDFGSLEALRCQGGACCDPASALEKPGYFLSVAIKQRECEHG